MENTEQYEEESLMTNDCDELLEIHEAIIKDDADKLDELCSQAGKNLNGKFMDELDPQHVNMTPLALAAALNKQELVKVLLKRGADVDATFANLKTTALMTSSFHGHAPVVKLLLENGADVRKTDVQKSTSLGYCFGGSRSESVVTLLLRAGIDVNISNVLGMNAFLLVSGYGNENLLRMVLQAGANTRNAVNNFGHTPIHLCVLGKQSQIDAQTGKGRYCSAHYGLNRRNMKTLLSDWSNRNRSTYLNGVMLDQSYEQTGQLMEDLGALMTSPYRGSDGDDDDLWTEEEVMKYKIDVASKYRREKLSSTASLRKSGIIDSFLTCGGKLGSKQSKASTTQQPSNAISSIPLSEPPPPLDEEREFKVQALCENFARSLRALLDAGCKVDETEYTFGLTALDISILNGDTESTAILLSSGADHNHLMKMLALSELYRCFATDKPDRKQIKDLLDYDPHLDLNMSFENANIPTRLSESENDEMLGDAGLTPISVVAKAADNSTFDIIKMLIKKGANPNQVGKGGRTTLGEACRWGNVKMVEFLISLGADMEQTNPAFNDATPLSIAVLERQPRIVEYLISKGAAVDKMMSDGRTSLIHAADAGNMAMVETLLRSNLNSNFTDPSGFDYQISRQYQSPDKDIRKIIESIHSWSSQLREQDKKRLEAERRIHEEMQEAGQRDRRPPDATQELDEQTRTGNIYEEIGGVAASILPKIRKKKKKSTDSTDASPYELIGEDRTDQAPPPSLHPLPPPHFSPAPMSGEDPVYSEVRKTKKSSSNSKKSAKSAEQEPELDSGEVKVQPRSGKESDLANKSREGIDSEEEQKPQTGKRPEPTPRGVAATVNGLGRASNLHDEGHDLESVERDIGEGMKNVDLNATKEEPAAVVVVPVKRKKKVAQEGNSVNHEEKAEEVQVPNVQQEAPISMDGLDEVIIKPRARRRRTRMSTESGTAEHVTEEEKFQSIRVDGGGGDDDVVAVEHQRESTDAVKVKKKRKPKISSVASDDQ